MESDESHRCECWGCASVLFVHILLFALLLSGTVLKWQPFQRELNATKAFCWFTAVKFLHKSRSIFEETNSKFSTCSSCRVNMLFFVTWCCTAGLQQPITFFCVSYFIFIYWHCGAWGFSFGTEPAATQGISSRDADVTKLCSVSSQPNSRRDIQQFGNGICDIHWVRVIYSPRSGSSRPHQNRQLL